MSRHKLIALACLVAGVSWGAGSEKIRLNQVGYVVGQPKFALSLDPAATAGTLLDSSGKPVFQAHLGAQQAWDQAGDNAKVFDFSTFDQPGTYTLQIGTEISHPIRLSVNPYQALARASIKAFWYNRSSYAPSAPYAGAWARAAGHPDMDVEVHPSAASPGRPAGTKIKSPGGWYDAGDFNKYVVNSGISTWTLLHLYETSSSYFDTLQLNVAPHGGPRSDLVDEILWNLRWMLTMQDPYDGGAYHKLTTAAFSDFKFMPSGDVATRYVVQKSTQATFDLAADAAYAARLFRKDSVALPGFADSCLKVALAAWSWGRANPAKYYSQAALSNPAIGTGEYGDGNASDEQSWAASELYLTTGADSFATKANLATQIPAPATGWGRPSWGNVATLGWMSLQANKSLLKGSLAGLGPKLDSGLTKYAAKARDERKANGYHLPQGDLNWGGTSEYANSGILLWKAWMTTGDTSYRNASLEALDYLLGRNATGYCLVTGFGGKPVMNPHHRISFADGVVPPVPGFLSGGPNSTAGGTGGDGCKGYPNEAAKRFLDQQPCYESNEIAINWNSPLAYLVGVWSARLDGNSSSGVHQVALRRASRIQWTNHAPIISANQNGQKLIRLDLVTPDGRLLERAVGPSLSLSVRTSHSGFVLAKAWAADGSTETSSFLLP